MQSRHVSCVIAASPEAVHAFASDPDNLPRWAAGLASGDLTREGDVLRVASPMGAVVVRFVADNEWGILDHEVTLPSGETVLNPVRVVAHPEGAEVVFTIRQRGLSDDVLDRDAATVLEDLERLKGLVEAG